MAPMKSVQMRTNYAPWLSIDTLELIEARDDVQKLASETKSRYEDVVIRVSNDYHYCPLDYQ